MATQTLLTIDMVTRELARNLENESMVLRTVRKGYDDKFAQDGAQIGDTVRLRMPDRFYASDGATFVDQDYTESYVNLQLSSQKHVGFSFTSKDMTLSMDDYAERTLKPAAITLANKIDLDVLSLAKSVYNNVGAPTVQPGTVTGANMANSTAVNLMTNAGATLDNCSCPRDIDNRHILFNPLGNAGVSRGLSGMYNDRAKIAQTYRDGRLRGTHLGFNVGMDQNVNTITTGTRVSGAANGANQTGATLNIDGIGNATTVVVGDKFTLAGVYALNPVNQLSTGQLQQFVATTDKTASAGGVVANLGISPSIVVAAANVANATVTASPANDAAIVWAGGAGVAAAHNLAFHKDAIVFATADLEMPEDTKGSFRLNHNGISLRVWKFSDGTTDRHKCRVDVLYGYALRRPEHACVIFG